MKYLVIKNVCQLFVAIIFDFHLSFFFRLTEITAKVQKKVYLFGIYDNFFVTLHAKLHYYEKNKDSAS